MNDPTNVHSRDAAHDHVSCEAIVICVLVFAAAAFPHDFARRHIRKIDRCISAA
jgi:hypothetical protein